jgi:replicative DNA helicase
MDVHSFDENLKNTFQYLSDIKSNSHEITGIPSGHEKIDEMLSGFNKGFLTVVAGAISSGKSSFILQAAHHAALNNKVLFISFESSLSALSLRLLEMRLLVHKNG